MNYLLDTHTFLWFIGGNQELSRSSRAIIENPDTVKYISIASFWEIAIKLNIQKLKLEMPFHQLEWHAFQNGFRTLPITFAHTNILLNLPAFHKDSFDRIIISQAVSEHMTILTRDANFDLYNLNVNW